MTADKQSAYQKSIDSLPMLYLFEEILLLALRESEGTFICGPMYSHAMGGAILSELLLAERIRVVEERRNKAYVEFVSNESMGDPTLDQCLKKIAESKRRATVQTWVGRFANMREMRHEVAKRLCDLGVLKAESDKVLWIFTRRIYPERDPRPELQVVDRLERAIFGTDDDVDSRTVVLLALAYHSGLLRYHFDRKRLRQQRKRIEMITSGDLIGGATKAAIQATQAAVIAATTVASSAAIVSS